MYYLLSSLSHEEQFCINREFGGGGEDIYICVCVCVCVCVCYIHNTYLEESAGKTDSSDILLGDNPVE